MVDKVSVFAFQTRRMSAKGSVGYLSNQFPDLLADRRPYFIVMPEKWVTDIMDEDSEDLSRILTFFIELSDKTDSVIIPGSFSVKRGVKLFNSSPVIAGGKILGWQDKITLFNREKESYASGTEAKIFESSGLKFTVSVCYDSDFPYYARMAAMRGSEIMINPALIHRDFHDMWKIYVEARTLENRLPFVSVNSLSDPFNGDSMISVPEKYMFGAKLNTRIYGNRETIHETLSLDGLKEMRDVRLSEDPGSYGFNRNEPVY